MANQHFGNIGDIWKHLPITELLHVIHPDHYWESHAGSALYPLSPNDARNFGVFHFMQHASEHPILRDSIYTQCLNDIALDSGKSPVYPGSAYLAFAALADNPASQYCFCDIDGNSIISITDTAEQLLSDPKNVQTHIGDGIQTIMGKLNQTDVVELSGVFLLIDPFHLTAKNDTGHTSLDLFSIAANCGCMTVLWYCAQTQDERNNVNMHLDQLATGIDQQLWKSEITLRSISEPQFHAPGVGMCGLLCANLPAYVYPTVDKLGQMLEQIYTNAVLPDGLSGVIDYTSSPVLESTMR